MRQPLENSPAEKTPQLEAEPSPRYALISVSDKSGVADMARRLTEMGYTIISTGGTGRTLEQKRIPFTPVQDITGNPEAFDGRMKSLSYQVGGALLYDRSNAVHVQQAHELGIPNIELVVCNLYPFAETIARSDATMDEAIENIDVGGPTMIRAAAKNYKSVLVVTDPADYSRIANALATDKVTLELRRELAAKAFAHLANYDAQIAAFLNNEEFPEEKPIPSIKALNCRYGDNPDQRAALFFIRGQDSILKNLKRQAGREPSATNITDIAAGIESVKLFSGESPCVAVIKHNSGCGLALGKNVAEALARALESDPVSAFGGVVVLNSPMTMEAAKVIEQFRLMGRGNMDIIAAPEIDRDTSDFLNRLRKSTGIYTFGEVPKRSKNDKVFKFFAGGFIVQDVNDPEDSFVNWQVLTGGQPTEKELFLMRVGWKFISRIKSNTVIVIDSRLPMTRGIGSGQTSRVSATELALKQAGKLAQGAYLVSDGFFPKTDSVELAAESGIKWIVQPGGSISDQDVILAAQDRGIKMIFTGQRLFWH